MFLIKPVIIGIGLCSLVAYSDPAQAGCSGTKTVEEQAQTRWEEQAENIGLGRDWEDN
jgi:hypothetical protein